MYFSTEWVSGCKCFLSSGEKWQHSNGIDWCLVFIYFKQNNNFTKLYTLYTHSITELWRLMKKDIPSRRSFNFILNWSSLHWSMTCAARQDIEYYEPFLFLQLFFFFCRECKQIRDIQQFIAIPHSDNHTRNFIHQHERQYNPGPSPEAIHPVDSA